MDHILRHLERHIKYDGEKKMNAHSALAIFLVLEHRKGEESEFFNYLQGQV